MDQSTRIASMNDFYCWRSELEKEKHRLQEKPYTDYITELNNYYGRCSEVQDLIHTALKYIHTLEIQHQQVSEKTERIHSACEKLLGEQTQLETFIDSLDEALEPFSELDAVTASVRNKTQAGPATLDPEFLATLSRIDSYIERLSLNNNFREAEKYVLAYKSLQRRSIVLIRTHVLNAFEHTTQTIMGQLNELKASNDEVKQTELFSLFYARFTSLAQVLRPIIRDIEDKLKATKNPQYMALLKDLQQGYVQQRKYLLLGNIVGNLQKFSEEGDVEHLVRTGSSYILRLSHKENDLYLLFFQLGNHRDFCQVLTLFASTLHSTLRPYVIHEKSIHQLYVYGTILKVEIVEEQLDRMMADSEKKLIAKCVQPVIMRTLGDIHERLLFVTQTFLRDAVCGYRPQGADLDYPNKLIEAFRREQNENSSHEDNVASIYQSWYPPLEKTLLCLSKLYLLLDRSLFEGLAQEAVSDCTLSIVQASDTICKQKPLDGRLFLVWQLLILREQITPFDIEFVVRVKTLDFAPVKSALGGLSDYIPFWSKSSSTATSSAPLAPSGTLWNRLLRSSPREVDSQIDSKRELEETYREAIHIMIKFVTDPLLEPLTSFLTKASAFLNVNKSSSPATPSAAGSTSSLLASQQFSKPSQVTELHRVMCERLEKHLTSSVLQITLYLRGHQRELRRILGMLSSAIAQQYDRFYAVLEGNYSDAERDAMHIDTREEAAQRLASYFAVDTHALFTLCMGSSTDSSSSSVTEDQRLVRLTSATPTTSPAAPTASVTASSPTASPAPPTTAPAAPTASPAPLDL